MLLVISYDIADDARRQRVSSTLLDYGVRVQYSVFECHLNRMQQEQLLMRLNKIIDPARDSVRAYRLCEICRERATVAGKGTLTQDPDYYVI